MVEVMLVLAIGLIVWSFVYEKKRKSREREELRARVARWKAEGIL